MPKRKGYIFEEVIQLSNCYAAIMDGTRNLNKTRKDVQRVLNNVDATALYMSTVLSQDWSPGPVTCKTIREGPRRKERHLLIPSLMDHLFHVAIMLPAIPYLMNRYDYYSCGSIRKRGPARVLKNLKKWICDEHYEYAAVCDVYHCYQTMRSTVIMNCLSKVFKDKRYLHLHEQILEQMSQPSYRVVNSLDQEDATWMEPGIAIGFQPSHWYANLVLTETDRLLRQQFPKIKFVRYMDNYAMLSRDKSELHHAINSLKHRLAELGGLKLKNDWQVFPIESRPLEFLSFRYFANGKVLMRKPIMFGITKKAKKTAKNFTVHNARSFVSKIGTADHAQSYTFKSKYIYPIISIKSCRRLVGYVDKKRNLQRDSTLIRDSSCGGESGNCLPL